MLFSTTVSQNVQPDCPGRSTNLPFSQSVQEAAPRPLNLPATQSTQAVFAALACLPASQGSQNAADSSPATKPESHLLQELTPKGA